jgi:hypothetical protein
VEYLGRCALIKPTPVALMPFKLLHSGIMRYDDSLEGQLGDLVLEGQLGDMVFYPDSTEVSILGSETDSFLTGQPRTA